MKNEIAAMVEDQAETAALIAAVALQSFCQPVRFAASFKLVAMTIAGLSNGDPEKAAQFLAKDAVEIISALLPDYLEMAANPQANEAMIEKMIGGHSQN